MPRNHVSYLGARAPQLVNVFIWAWVLTRNAQVPMESQKMLKRHDQRSFDSGLIISQRADIDGPSNAAPPSSARRVVAGPDAGSVFGQQRPLTELPQLESDAYFSFTPLRKSPYGSMVPLGGFITVSR